MPVRRLCHGGTSGGDGWRERLGMRIPKNGVEWSHKTANFISILSVYHTNVYIYIDSRSTYTIYHHTIHISI